MKKWKKKIKWLESQAEFLHYTDKDILDWQNDLARRVERLELDGSDLDSELIEEPPMNSIIIDRDAMSWQRFRAGWYANSWDLSAEAPAVRASGATAKTWEYMRTHCSPMQLIISGEKVWTSMDRERFGNRSV